MGEGRVRENKAATGLIKPIAALEKTNKNGHGHGGAVAVKTTRSDLTVNRRAPRQVSTLNSARRLDVNHR
jgi:hypothetical protein